MSNTTGEFVVQAGFCSACACWVPLHPDRREEMWQQHPHGNRHAREVAARLAEEAKLDSTSHYRSACNPPELPISTACSGEYVHSKQF